VDYINRIACRGFLSLWITWALANELGLPYSLDYLGPEAGSYKDSGKVAQKPTFWKAGFSPNEKVILEQWLKSQVFTTVDHAQWNSGLSAPVQ